MKVDEIDAGFGIDMLRLEAVQTEPIHARTIAGHAEARRVARNRLEGNTAVEDLMAKLGARVGLEVITRRHPAASHIPEKTAQVLAAAWSEPARDWPAPPRPRPLQMWQPEPVMCPPPFAGAGVIGNWHKPPARNGSRRNGGWMTPTGAAVCAITGLW